MPTKIKSLSPKKNKSKHGNQAGGVTLDGIVASRPRKDSSVVEPNTTSKTWASEIRLTGLESDKERREHETPSCMLAQPTVLHFGGYELNKRQTQTLRVVNKSLDTIRLTLLKPTTPYFQLRWKREKPGFLAPGMTLEVEVDFAPTEWRYYYDCVRLNCGEEKILVPIHAYPVMNKAMFPKRFDVGKERLGSTKRRSIKLRCTAPIAFEFEIAVTKEHYDFKISPRRGVVPANGVVPIVVEYTPTKLATSECKIQLNIAQFNYQPFETTIVGSGVTDFISDIGEDDEAPAAFGTTNKRGVTSPEAAEVTGLLRTAKGHTAGAGAVLDAGTEYAAKLNRRQARKAAARAKEKEQKSEYLTETKDGVKVPRRLDGHHTINFVLTQQQGKLKPKDLKRAISEQQAVRKAQEEALRAASRAHHRVEGGNNEGGGRTTKKSSKKKNKQHSTAPGIPERDRGPGSGPSLPTATIVAEAEAKGREAQSRQIRDATFIQEMNTIEAEERQREFKSAEVIGEPVMDPSDIEKVVATRTRRQEELDAHAREVDRQRTETETAGPYQDPPAHCPVPLAEIPKILAHPAYQPKFNHYVNDTWNMRGRVVQKFVASVTKFIVRRRIDERLAAIKRRLGVGAGAVITREAVAALVDRDQKAQASKGGSDGAAPGDGAAAAASDGTIVPAASDAEAAAIAAAEAAALAKERAAPVKIQYEAFYERFSQYDADATGGGATGAPPAPASLPQYQNLQYSALVIPKEYELAGYEEDPLPAFQTYVPGESDREFRGGAVEEESFRPQKNLQELDQSEQAQLARVQHQRYIAEEEKDAARRAFQKYDKDGSGSIDAGEMAMVLSDLGVVNLDEDDPVLKSVMDSADVDDDGEVSFKEFLVFFRSCLAAKGDAAARAGDASKRLDLTFFHPRGPAGKPTPQPVHLADNLRAHRAYEALPPPQALEFDVAYELRPRPVGATLAQRAAANEQAHLLQDAAAGFLTSRYEPRRAPVETLPVFFQSPLEAVAAGGGSGGGEFDPTADLVPWRAANTPWHMVTPGGQTVPAPGTAVDPIPAGPVTRPELGAAADKELRDEFEKAAAAAGKAQGAERRWTGITPTALLLNEPQSDDDLSDSDTDSDDEWGLPLRPGRDVLLTPAMARHFGEGLSLDALLAREHAQAIAEFEQKSTAIEKAVAAAAGGSASPAQEAAREAVQARIEALQSAQTTTDAAAAEALGGSEAAKEAVASVAMLLTAQPRTVGSVFGRDLKTDADGEAPSVEEQFRSPLRPPAGDGDHENADELDGGERREEGRGEAQALETDEARDERLARQQTEHLAALARDTHRDMRWTSEGAPGGENGLRRPEQQMFRRDAAMVEIADLLDEERMPQFHALPKAIASLTENAIDPQLRVVKL